MTSQHSDSTIPGQRLSFDEPQHLCDAGIGVGLHKSDKKLGQPDLTPFHPADTVAVRPVPFSAFPTSFFGRPGFLH